MEDAPSKHKDQDTTRDQQTIKSSHVNEMMTQYPMLSGSSRSSFHKFFRTLFRR